MLHFNVTANPTAEWTARQLIHAFPEETVPRFLGEPLPGARQIGLLAGRALNMSATCNGLSRFSSSSRLPRAPSRPALGISAPMRAW